MTSVPSIPCEHIIDTESDLLATASLRGLIFDINVFTHAIMKSLRSRSIFKLHSNLYSHDFNLNSERDVRVYARDAFVTFSKRVII